jgi:hypothetical protein
MLILKRVLVLACAAAALAQTPAATRQLLLGDHLFSLQWISWERFGKVAVTEEGGTLRIRGEQRNQAGDFVTLDGAIPSVLPNGFRFHGRIVTRVSYINKGAPCVRDGDFPFTASGARKFWRMQQYSNPCDEAADYVDVFFKRP